MVFDPMKFYDDGQRRQKRYDSLVPVFVVALVMLVVFGAGFIAYQRSHIKPKPEQWAYQGRLCKGTDCREAITASTATDLPLMSRCNSSGGYVTDLKDCKTPNFSATVMVPLDRPRKHKRKKLGTLTSKYLTVGTGGWAPTSGVDDYNPHAHVTLQQLKNAQGLGQTCILAINGGCWITLDPDPEKKKPDCPAAPSGDGDYYVDSDGCLRVSFTPMPATCGADEECRWSVAHVTPDKPGIAEKAAEYDELVLDHSGDFYDNVFVPGGECTDRERYRELQCQMGGKCLLRNLDSKNWCPVVEWHIDPPAKPDCKMPADVDVCPAQTLDPKAVDDKKAKP